MKRKVKSGHVAAGLLLISLLFVSISTNISQVKAVDPWSDADWGYRKPITINYTKVDDDFLNFPVLIDIVDSDIQSKAQTDGDDIFFTDSVGTKLDHEIEFYNSSSGKLICWVEVLDVSSTSNTTIYMYYGNSGSTDQQNSSGVWGSNYVLVQHLMETSGAHVDSSPYGNDGSALGGVVQDATGQIDGADEFDGSNDNIEIPHDNSLAGFTSGFSISAWVNMDDNVTRQVIIQKYYRSDPERAWMFEYDNYSTPGVLVLFVSPDGENFTRWYANFAPELDTWYHVAVVWEPNIVPSFYVDGQSVAAIGAGTEPSIYNNTGASVLIATDTQSGREFDGIIDEIRVSDTNRTSTWIATQYRNQLDPAGFYSVGIEEIGQTYYVNASAGTGGSISPEGLVAVSESTNKTFNIIPDDGYHITDVIVDSVSQGVTYTYTFTTITANHTINAQFAVTTPPIIILDKSTYELGDTVTINVTGGTANKPVMLQIDNPSSVSKWADQGDFETDGTFTYQLKIPTSGWGYDTYTIYIRDVDAGTNRQKNLVIQSTVGLPVADAGGPYSGYSGRTIYFDGTGSSDVDGGTIEAYEWDFGDGNSGVGIKPSHIYSSVGTYTVNLTVTDNDNLTGSNIATATIRKYVSYPSLPSPSNKKPVADAGPNQDALVGRVIYFDGSGSTDSDGTITQYFWFFGDGSSESGITASHSYLAPGEYNVTLSVSDNRGATASDIAVVTVETLPIEPVTGVDESVGADEIDYVVDALDEADTSITLNTSKQVTVTVVKYPENPHPDVQKPNNTLPTIVDIFMSNHDAVNWPIHVEMHYTDSEIEGLNESRLAIYYFKDGAWHVCRETGVYPDLNIVWANMYEDEVAGVPLLIAPRPFLAEFEVTDLSIIPSEVEPDESVDVTVYVINVGGEDGNYTATLMINGEVEDETTITVNAGDTSPINFTVTRSEEDTYTVEVNGLTGNFTVRELTPAQFDLVGIELSTQVAVSGEEIQVTVDFLNIGEKTGSHTVIAKLDGIQVFSESITLDGGASAVVRFHVTPEEIGSHIVEIDGQTISFTVEELAMAEFQYDIISVVPSIAEPGETVTIDVNIENVGEKSGEFTATLMLDGEMVDAITESLSGGESTIVVFETSSEIEGIHILEVDGSTESFEVVIVEPEPTPQIIPWLWIDLLIIVIAVGVVYYLRKRDII